MVWWQTVPYSGGNRVKTKYFDALVYYFVSSPIQGTWITNGYNSREWIQTEHENRADTDLQYSVDDRV